LKYATTPYRKSHNPGKIEEGMVCGFRKAASSA
jgi:hypothetical protein